MSEENEDPTRSFMTRDSYDKEEEWEENKEKLEFPGYSYVRHTSNEYLSGIRKGADGYAHSAMQLNISDLKGAMGEGSDYDDTAIKRELENQGKAIEANTDAIADKSDKDHTHDNITDPYDDSWIQPEIDKKSDKGHTHDISHDHDTEYQPVGDYADKNHLHNFDHIHDDYLTSDDLPDPYDDTQIRDDFAAADQNLQDQITIINDAGYDDSGIKLSIALEEEARIAGDDALSVRIDGKADDDHIHDPIDLTHNHNSQYQPIGDYATKTDLDSKSDTTHSHPPQDTTHDHDAEYQPVGNYADKDHNHPPQDLTHDHDAEYAPVHEHPYSDKDHTHPPQDLTHNHDSDYQPLGDYATNQTVADGDKDLQDQIDAISSSGGYNDSWIEPAINTGDANTLQGAKQYTDEEVAKVFVPDVSDFATTGYVDAGDAAVEAKIPDVSNFATNQELTDGLAGKSNTTHDHDEFTHTHDFTHDHDGQYALEHNHPYASDSHTHDTTHDHFGEYAGKAEFDAHHHDEEYLTSDDLPDPYDDSGIKGLIANEESARVAGDQSLQTQIDTINTSGYDDTEVRALIQGNADAIEGKADDPHSHSDYSLDGHTHPPQDLTHNHDGEYLTSDDLPEPYDDSEVKSLISSEESARVAGDAALQDQIDTIQSSGYDDTALRGLISDEEAARITGDATTLSSANTYTDSKVYDDTALESSVAQNTSDISDLQTEQGTQNSAIQENTDAIALLENYDDGDLKDLIAAEETARIAGDAGLASDIAQNTSDIAAINANGAYDGSWIQPAIDAGDATALASANTYTNEEIAKIPATDVSDLATKTELSAGLAGKADDPHNHDEFADKDHAHPPQDLTHNHDTEYAPVHNHPYASDSHTHPPQDLTHDHDADYQAKGNYASDDHTHAPHNHNGLYSPTTHLHDDNYAEKSHEHDTSHFHTEYAETRHDHDGTYQPKGDYSLDGHKHDTSHNHPEYFPSGQQTDENGDPIPLPYSDALALGDAVDGKADEHEHPYVSAVADTDIKPTADNRFITLKNRRPKEADGTFKDEEFGLEINLDEGNTWKSQFSVGTRHGYALKVLGGTGKTIWAGGKIQQKGDDKSNTSPEDYIVRQNLTDAIDELQSGIDNHTHGPEMDDLTWSDLGNYKFHRASDDPGSGILQCKVPGGAPHATKIEKVWVHKTNKGGVTHNLQTILKEGNFLKLGKGEQTAYYKIVVSVLGNENNIELDIEWLSGFESQFFYTDTIKVGEGTPPKYFPIGDWSDSEYEPYADLRQMDESYLMLYEASEKAQKIIDGAQNRRLDELEVHSHDEFVSLETFLSLQSKVEELEARLNALEGTKETIDLGTFTFSCDNGRPTGSSQTLGVAGIFHSKIADSTTTPVNEVKLNNGSVEQANRIVNNDGGVLVRFTQDNKTQEWVCENGGWITATNVLHITASEVSGYDLVDGVEGNITVYLR